MIHVLAVKSHNSESEAVDRRSIHIQTLILARSATATLTAAGSERTHLGADDVCSGGVCRPSCEK